MGKLTGLDGICGHTQNLVKGSQILYVVKSIKTVAILARPYRWLGRSMKGKTMSACLAEQDLCVREAVHTLTYTFNIAVNMSLL